MKNSLSLETKSVISSLTRFHRISKLQLELADECVSRFAVAVIPFSLAVHHGAVLHAFPIVGFTFVPVILRDLCSIGPCELTLVTLQIRSGTG